MSVYPRISQSLLSFEPSLATTISVSNELFMYVFAASLSLYCPVIATMTRIGLLSFEVTKDDLNSLVFTESSARGRDILSYTDVVSLIGFTGSGIKTPMQKSRGSGKASTSWLGSSSARVLISMPFALKSG